MSIKKRGVTWHINVTIRGTKLRQSLHTADREEARKRAKALEDALWAGEMLPKTKKGPTLGEAFDESYAIHWSDTKDARNVQSRFKTLTRFIPHDTAVTDIDQTMVNKLVKEMKEATYTRSDAQGAAKYPYSRTTINRVLALLGFLLHRAEDKGEIVKAPKLPKTEEAKRNRFLSREEEIKMFSALLESDNPNHKRCFRLFVFLAYSGCRLGEAKKLTWADVDTEKNSVILMDTKSGQNVRKDVVPLVMEVLAQERLEGFEKPFDGIGETMYRNAWDYAKAAAGLSDDKALVRHSLRHTTASRLAEAGLDLKRVQEYLGHRSYQTTLRYTHLTAAAQQDSVNALTPVSKMWSATRVTTDVPRVEAVNAPLWNQQLTTAR